MNVLAYLKLDIVHGDSHRNRLLMFVKHVHECCQDVQQNCPKKGRSQVQMLLKLAKELSYYMTHKDLMEESKTIEALEPSMLCDVTPSRIKKKLRILNEDIQHFHKFYGSATDDIVFTFKMPKHWRNSKRPKELKDSFMINRFCTHAEDVLHVVTDIDQRLQSLKAMLQPTEGTSMIREEYPVDQLENIHVNGEIIENLFKTNAGTRRDMAEMRKCNRKVNMILREEDFELSEYDQQRLKLIKCQVSCIAASCGIVSPSCHRLRTFNDDLLEFKVESKCCRMKHLKKCLDLEKHFVARNICSSNENQDVIIVQKMASFFKKVLDDYKMFDNHLNIMRTKLDKLWNYYM